jgi:MoCo/4Fe-4S cofactor protein with predicted Tat translocation signal
MADKCPSHSHQNDPADPAGAPAPWSDGKRYWRSLEEFSGSPAFWDKVHREFPRYASQWTDDLSRRSFLKVMGASIALAGSAGCFKKPEQQVVPYVTQPEMITPGIPLHFATALPVAGRARGVLVRSDEGRPTKIEGNPQHGASLGATDAVTQAMLLELYDPDRSQSIVNDGQISSWDLFMTDPKNGMADKLAALQASGGKGLVIMTGVNASPTLGNLLSNLFQKLPAARWFRHEPVGRNNSRDGAETAFGKDRRNIETNYQFDQADVVLSLDCNFLMDDPASLLYARQFIDRRRVRADRRGMNRLYAVEGTYSITGAMADHRLAVKPSRVEAVARAIAANVGLSDVAQAADLTATETAFAKSVATDLSAHSGSSIVAVGESQPAIVHALAHAINDRLGNTGKTVTHIDSVEIMPAEPWESLAELTAAMDGGDVQMLLILDANPCYTKPAEVDFAASLKKFSLAQGDDGRPLYASIRHGLFEDETSLYCQWHLPASHGLEAWNDLRAFDGTVTFCQPLIDPLYDSRSAIEVINWIGSHLLIANFDDAAAVGMKRGHELVRDYWQSQPWRSLTSATDFDIFWETALHDGVVPGTAYTPLSGLSIQSGALAAAASASSVGMEIVYLPDPHVGDGRFANSGWLQELPKPLCKLTWDNAVLLSVATAKKLGVNNDDLVSLSVGGHTLAGPQVAVWVVPGHADDCTTIYLGYGRTRAGRVGNGTGFNAYDLRTADAPHFAGGLTITKQDGAYRLVTTQGSQSMEGRDLIRVGSPDYAYDAAEKAEKAEAAESQSAAADDSGTQGPARIALPLITLYPETPGHAGGQEIDPQWQAWGMVIDNNACIGCNACVVACQAENNIPVVGKEQVGKGREMHWLRIDTYFTAGLDAEGVPAPSVSDDAYDASTNRGAGPGAQGLGPGNAGGGAMATDVHAYFEPVTCMQCEKAPCELVCPVGATLHDQEGLNNMIYNRCVGTRYCSNNCPYKVRRFNFFQYSDETTTSLALGRNPDVTVRTRGVMEKCSYCVQRISAARIAAKKAEKYDENGKPIIEDGSLVTACQQVCPTQAIVFGDIGDEQSKVRKLKEEPLNYILLEEVQARPRTSYLWRLTNPNPEMSKA